MRTGGGIPRAWWLAVWMPVAGCRDPAAPAEVGTARVRVTNDYVLHVLGVPPGNANAIATDINGAGVIVGWGQAAPPATGEHAFRYAEGQWTVLPLSRAYGINDAGWIVGSEEGAPAVLSPSGDLTILTLSGTPVAGVAFGINASDMVVGRSRVTGGHWEATRWTVHDGAYLAESLESVAALESQATAVNDAGEIVGSVTLPADRLHPTRREAWTWHDGPQGERLGELEDGDDAVATAINMGGFLNPTGLIVGLGNLEPGGTLHAFVQPLAGSGLVEMSLPGTWSALTGVSDGGRLIGWYTSSTPSPSELPYHDPNAVGSVGAVPLKTVPFTRVAGKRVDLAHHILGPTDGGGAASVNRCGTIVGHIVTELSLQAAFWSKPRCDP